MNDLEIGRAYEVSGILYDWERQYIQLRDHPLAAGGGIHWTEFSAA
jgi:hypothetical protein